MKRLPLRRTRHSKPSPALTPSPPTSQITVQTSSRHEPALCFALLHRGPHPRYQSMETVHCILNAAAMDGNLALLAAALRQSQMERLPPHTSLAPLLEMAINRRIAHERVAIGAPPTRQDESDFGVILARLRPLAIANGALDSLRPAWRQACANPAYHWMAQQLLAAACHDVDARGSGPDDDAQVGDVTKPCAPHPALDDLLALGIQISCTTDDLALAQLLQTVRPRANLVHSPQAWLLRGAISNVARRTLRSWLAYAPLERGCRQHISVLQDELRSAVLRQDIEGVRMMIELGFAQDLRAIVEADATLLGRLDRCV